MGNQTPKLTIGMPVYNAEDFIQQAIDSILNQTFRDFVLIIADNCSTDQTQAICEAYVKQDSRVQYHRHKENIGANRNFNYVFTLVETPYFKWAAHDDYLSPDYLEKCMHILESDSSFVLAHSQTRLIDIHDNELTVPTTANYVKDENGNTIFVGVDSNDRQLDSIHADDRFRAILETGWCYEVFGVIRTDALRQTPVLRLFYGADKVLLAELGAIGRFAIIPEKLFHNRRHPQQSRSQTVTERIKWSNAAFNKFSKFKMNLDKALAYTNACWKGSMPLSMRVKCLDITLKYNLRKFAMELGIIEEIDILR